MAEPIPERPIQKIKKLQGESPQTPTDENAQWPAGEEHVPPFVKGTPGVEDWKPGAGSFSPEPERPKAPSPKTGGELPHVPPFVEEEKPTS